MAAVVDVAALDFFPPLSLSDFVYFRSTRRPKRKPFFFFYGPKEMRQSAPPTTVSESCNDEKKDRFSFTLYVGKL